MESRLVSVRNKMKMNQEQFAAFLGIPKTTYHNYESGRSDLKSDFLVSVARKCNVSIDYILGTQEEMYVLDRIDLTQSEIRLIETYRLLNSIGKDKTHDYVSDLVGNDRYRKDVSPDEREKMA